MDGIYAVILAAGKGTRMRSKLYKILHPVCEKPMVQHVVDTVSQLQPEEMILVVGHGAEKVREQVGPEATYVLQEEQLGTGHAAKCARGSLEGKGGVTMVLMSDTPLLTKETLFAMVEKHQISGAAVTVLTTEVDDPTGYGRIVSDEEGNVIKIVEHKDASSEELQIREINSGIFCFRTPALVEALDQLTNDNAQQEYYLTDCLGILHDQGEKIARYQTSDIDEIMGINDRVALSKAEKMMQRKINEKHMLQGVTMIAPDHTYIGTNVTIGADTVLYPGTYLAGDTVIGEDCVIGPNTELRNMKVGHRCHIQQSVLIDSDIGDETTVGPFAYVRPGSKVGQACKIGDFVEVKNSIIGNGSKVPHLSYIGDAEIGEKVNMGCGSITVNYDGENKHKTIVEDHSFVGCNVNLVAPVTIGKGSYIAAGSTINRSIPENSFAIARERQITKEDYASKFKKK